jgi:hypothetical protein
MTNTFMPGPDFLLKSYIDFTTFNYGVKRWKQKICLE